MTDREIALDLTHQVWLTPTEAAAYARLSRRTLEAYRRFGRGPRYARVAYNVVRYRRDDLDRWLEAGARAPRTAEAQR